MRLYAYAVAAAVVLFSLPGTLKAQEIELLADSVVENTVQADKSKLLIGGGIMLATAIYDVETTYYGLGRGARELNPITGFFQQGGRPAMYLFEGTIIVFELFLTREFLENEKWRKWWWLPMVVFSGTKIIAGTNNLIVAASIRM